ncbi:MAG TPA: cupin domain-containing protein [Sporichthyaceae bacterium]|jgi:quercetin dioxygenase-like cupin family protein|nr:cupin domain-containing protein [Sporichthyaceae bacterium]
MQLVRDEPSGVGSEPMFSGDVWYTYHSGEGPVSCAKVHFSPGARTAWHTHPDGQVLYVLEGVVRVMERDGSTVDARAGESVVCPAGLEHWHGAAPGYFATHLAVHTGPVGWAEPVPDEVYLGEAVP